MPAYRSWTTTRGRNMAGALPVASDETAAGRYKNRRVEVWIEPRT